MSHILNLVTEIAETNQAKAIDAKFAKTRENRLFLKFWKYQDLRPIFAAWSISDLIQVMYNVCRMFDGWLCIYVLALQKGFPTKASSQGYVSSIRLALWWTLDPPVGEVKANQGESI